MTLDEQLSLLVAGELSEHEVRVLEARIALEPEVAVRHRQMQDMVGALERLPETAAPPLLAPEALPNRQRWRRSLPWGLAAAALLFALLRTSPQPEMILASGTTVVDGQISLLAGDVRIAVDGRASIFVEPVHPSMRVANQTALEDPLNTRTILAGVAGALITVTVYEGSALVMADDTSPVAIGPGEARSFGTPRAPTAAPNTPERARELGSRAEALAAELEATQKELATEKFAGAITRGQLAAREGHPSEWPVDVPPPMGAGRFEAELATVVEGLEDFEVSQVDCSEYPCVAALRYGGDDDSMEWGAPLGDAVGAWSQEVLGDHSLSVNHSRFRSDDSDERFVVFGAHTGAEGGAVGDRLRFRMDEMVEVLGGEVRETP